MKNNLKIYYWVASGLIVLSCIPIFLYPAYLGWGLSEDSNDWSNFGKYIGGVVGPLFSLLAFVGVLLSITNQNNENRAAEKERGIQSTEDRIIKHIEFHHNICDNVRIPTNLRATNFKEGRVAFDFLYQKHLKSYYNDEVNKNGHLDDEQKIDNAFTKLYHKHGRLFGFYFRNLFYLFKYIEESKDIDKAHYARLVRAQLSTPEIQMLMYNTLFKKGKNFKKFVVNYELLNGIDSSEMLDPNHETLFPKKAFGK